MANTTRTEQRQIMAVTAPAWIFALLDAEAEAQRKLPTGLARAVVDRYLGHHYLPPSDVQYTIDWDNLSKKEMEKIKRQFRMDPHQIEALQKIGEQTGVSMQQAFLYLFMDFLGLPLYPPAKQVEAPVPKEVTIGVGRKRKR